MRNPFAPTPRELDELLVELIETGQAVPFATPGDDYEMTLAAPQRAINLDCAGRERMPRDEALRRLHALDN